MSEQYLLDCAYEGIEGPNGCNGAWFEDYFKYAVSHERGRDQMEWIYPYKEELGHCKKVEESGIFSEAILTGQFTQWYGNEDDLLLLLHEQGPVATGLNAAPLHHYHSGYIWDTSLCCNAATDNYDRNTWKKCRYVDILIT